MREIREKVFPVGVDNFLRRESEWEIQDGIICADQEGKIGADFTIYRDERKDRERKKINFRSLKLI